MQNIITKDAKDQIDLICKKNKIGYYKINSDGSIDVDGDVDLSNKDLSVFPLSFNIVSGHFDCSLNKITSLIGGPKTVGGFYDCSYNRLTSLTGSPEHILDEFNCSENQLTSLVGGPIKVEGIFDCGNNQLSTLEGSPSVIGSSAIYQFNNISSTYSGDIDIEIYGIVKLPHFVLPRLLTDSIQYIKIILRNQRYYEIWNDDLTLNEENFNNLIMEINDGLE